MIKNTDRPRRGRPKGSKNRDKVVNISSRMWIPEEGIYVSLDDWLGRKHEWPGQPKPRRGRPKGSKNKPKPIQLDESPQVSEGDGLRLSPELASLIDFQRSRPSQRTKGLPKRVSQPNKATEQVFSLMTGERIDTPAPVTPPKGSRNRRRLPRQLFKLSFETPWGTFGIKLDGMN